MLRSMRKHARNWLMKLLLGIIIIVFIFYFGSMRGQKQAESLVIVDDKIISYTDFRNEYQGLINLYRQRLGNNFTDDVLKKLNLKQQALNNLIDRAVAERKADELKLSVSDEEVRSFILSYPVFQKNGIFDNNKYQQILRQYRMSPEDFEISQKMAFKIAKLEKLIKESVKVSEKEVYDIYRIQNEKINLEFIKIAVSNFRGKVKPTDADLKKHFEKNREAFRIPEKLQVKYITFFGEDFADTTEVKDEEVKDYYDQNKTKFAKSSGESLPLHEVKDKIIAEIRSMKGMNAAWSEAKKAHDIIYQEENFEDYATKNGSKINKTGFFTGNNPPPELAQIKDVNNYIFGLQEGEISPVLSSSKGFYVIKFVSRNPSHIPTISEAGKVIKKDYLERESQRLCRQEAEEILRRLKSREDISRLSREKRLKISDTGFFIPNPNIPKIGFSEKFQEALFQISENNPYPDDVFNVDGNFVIIKFKEAESLNDKDYETKKAELKNLLLRIKEQECFQSWIEETKASMMKKGEIKITKDISEL
jgi:peptidyl-prolyl cis-trans isomerase D